MEYYTRIFCELSTYTFQERKKKDKAHSLWNKKGSCQHILTRGANKHTRNYPRFLRPRIFLFFLFLDDKPKQSERMTRSLAAAAERCKEWKRASYFNAAELPSYTQKERRGVQNGRVACTNAEIKRHVCTHMPLGCEFDWMRKFFMMIPMVICITSRI